MKRSVGIIGLGAVGSSIAIAILHSGLADQLFLCDRNSDLAEGETMDLIHGASFYSTVAIKMTSIDEMKSADVIVVAAGRPGNATESRLDLLKDNSNIIHDIGTHLTNYKGVIVLVTNPVDVLTKVMVEASGLPASRVIGTGTMLDTARLKQSIGDTLKIDPHSVHAQVIGEHGDSEVILWSSVRIGGLSLDNLPHWSWDFREKIDHDVRYAAYKIIEKKGVSNHAVGFVAANLLKCIIRDERRILTVTHVQTDINELKDISLSLPTVVGAKGVLEVLVPSMSAIEKESLMHSARILTAASEQLKEVI